MGLELYPGLPALGAVIERIKQAKMVEEVVVATTINKEDNLLRGLASQFGAKCFRGSEDDVLGRVVGAGRASKADILVLVTGDCSCISSSLIDAGVTFFLKNNYDLVSNCLEDTYPIGIDLQVVDFKALEKAYDMAKQEPYKEDKNNLEHTNFFMRSHPEVFSVYQYPASQKYQRPDIQLTLDTAADLEVIRNIYRRLYPKKKFFDIGDILELLDKEPGILKPQHGLKVNRLGY
jgi:spore coat polysaccharide biosynthesis protein SpsF